MSNGIMRNGECTGSIRIRNGSEETVASARITRVEGEYRVDYDEPGADLAGSQTSVIIRVGEPPTITVQRQGAVLSAYSFTAGMATQGYFALPEGRLPFSLFTREVCLEVTETEIRAAIVAFMGQDLADEQMEVPEGDALVIDLTVRWD